MLCAYDFRDIKLDGYTNVNEIAPIKNRLHACETLFGDKNAEIMLLGQDAANFQRMYDTMVRDGEGPSGFRHGERVQTNINLKICLEEYISRIRTNDQIGSHNCNIFYANAIWLLKNTERMNGSMPNLREAMRVCMPVFDATFDGLTNLKLIITLGKVPYNFLRSINKGLSADWNTEVKSPPRQTISYRGKTVIVAPVFHPSPLSGGRNKADLKKSFERAVSALQM